MFIGDYGEHVGGAIVLLMLIMVRCDR